MAPGNDAGMNIERPPASAAYIRSLNEPKRMKGLAAAIWARTAALSGFTPGLRETEKAQGRPISSCRKRVMPRAWVSQATMAKLAVAKKSWVTLLQRSQIGARVVAFSRAMKGSGSSPVSSPSARRKLVVANMPMGAAR